ncbi:hypothetical protein NEMBOFW57_009908 [Staphylotrichum longicolle]|uniref:Uncharacterized protein n=1 Tax=Staphylotrichum longicolle TaxID=669026 RepID=A0AAD4HVU8_9PEZI|nr:hypothetical protein NEMBOFW57_009908 [Staphylotrichum longicolle]
MANSSCPGGNSALPSIVTLPIPQNINVMVRTGTNTSNLAMSTCCAPSRVQIVDGCYLWCEVPRRYFNGSSNRDNVMFEMGACIRATNSGSNITNDSVITGWQFNAGARAGPAGMAKQIGLWNFAVMQCCLRVSERTG